jgi:hypothetical protein
MRGPEIQRGVEPQVNTKQAKRAAAVHGPALVMPLWPDAGRALGLSRNATYDAARRGEIKTLRFGKLLKVPTVWLLETCGHKRGEAS